jgi:hypothetical protein
MVTLTAPAEEVLLAVTVNDTAGELPVRLLTYDTGKRDVHFPYGGLNREVITRAAKILEQRGLLLQDNTGEAWPTGIYFKVDAAVA